jgi:hypothetical protein
MDAVARLCTLRLQMKITLAGAVVPLAAFRDAVSGLAPGRGATPTLRQNAGRAWAQFENVNSSVLQALTEKLRCEVVVVEVEMDASGKGGGLLASQHVLAIGPSGPERRDERDLSEQADETLHEWRADAQGGFNEGEAATELAWALVENLDTDERTAPAVKLSLEDRWAQALLDKLVTSKSIELKPRRELPVEWVAHWLAWSDDDDLGERVFNALMESPLVEEVYADADDLAKLVRTTRPKK